MSQRLVVLLSLILSSAFAQNNTRHVPSIDDLLMVKSIGGAQISPEGDWIAYTINESDFKQDAFVTQIGLVNANGSENFQLTRGEKSSTNPRWSPDGKWLAFLSTRVGDKNQVFVIRPNGGEAAQLTKCENGVNNFNWSPDGTKIAFSATRNPDLIQSGTADIYVLTLADSAIKKIVAQAGPDNNPDWSPDGTQIIFSSAMGNPKYYSSNTRLAIVDANGGAPRSITANFDEQPGLVQWNVDGVYFTALQKTASHLFRVDPASGKVTRISAPDHLMAGAFSLTRDGKRLAFTASTATALNEVFVTDAQNFSPRVLTNMTEQAQKFMLGSREVIAWKSKDGAMIEGVLIKPADFDPAKKYPLLCIIHGGPTGIDRPILLAPDARYYPSDIWANRGALILKVNYRGSAGYGEKFRQLNLRNLGVGDAWDVLSGVDYLIGKGWVDPAKVGCMGWSQGGYISAFLTASTTRFAAISVGAGISNWATYYYNTDITPFTIQYLDDDPLDDPAIYQKTSPMTYLKQAATPTLIQHGENDKRVPIANAYELRQGLEDRGVKAEMVVYKGFGHGINKPKAMRAVMQHNLAWFNHFIWGDTLPDFTNPDLPKKEKPEKKAEASGTLD